MDDQFAFIDSTYTVSAVILFFVFRMQRNNSFSSYGTNFSGMHSFLIHRLPFSISSFSHLPSTGFITLCPGVCLPSFAVRNLCLLITAFIPAASILVTGLCLFTQPTMQCSPSLGHNQSGRFFLFLFFTQLVNVGKLHFRQHWYISVLNSCWPAVFNMLA